VSHVRPSNLPLLPLLLWDTPPGLELILAQEGVPFRKVTEPHALAFRGARFVIYDSRRASASETRAMLTAGHVALDADALRGGTGPDPFEAVVDNRGAVARWEVGGRVLTERVARHDKAAARRRVVDGLRQAVTAAGGVWARLSAFPFPYRSAFNLRADLDETCVADYARFARARRALADCCTHFVSTRAYGGEPAVLQDLRRFDTQSHGHHHVVYGDPGANRKNLERADDLLRGSGFEPVGFAAPHGRWNVGLDRVLEDLGYAYSSDFQVGYDDLPFFPWRGDTFSTVLQVPVHPVCEGLFFDAGETRGRAVAGHLVRVVRAKIDAGEPAFVYGHPERRLARYPEILSALADAVAGEALVWRVGLTEFARWWRWRGGRAWSLVERPNRGLEVQFDDWRPDYPLGLEVVRGRHVATVPLPSSRTAVRLDGLAYEARPPQADIPRPVVVKRPPGVKEIVRTLIDWETATPLDELPAGTIPERVKKRLRLWRQSGAGGVAR
jgi:hypothetical protein